ncbi:alpha/beta hydrolase [Thermocoleostomius sinensis]|uniref:Alpha/beta fold hydrolase n=1 Tax=Thermocoleostomius sinensis A174 TaxID=2016057 RepID=A0A9E9C6Q8_9CYAN|nr:alpha/beta hydrolase [Thermocoleostomius sinensis]WAL58473.1 alpha/beta fold hydrolase [Thermocoleostomius sinensis A174]
MVTHSTHRNHWRLPLISISLLAAFLPMHPVQAAERIYFNYGPLGFSIAVEDLERFAQTGEADGSLDFILRRLSTAQQNQVRAALQTSYPLDPVTVAQFSYTSAGEQLLQEAGELVRTPARQNGFYGIRSASILAAANPVGLSILHWMRLFPTDIQINLGNVLQFQQYIASLLQQTEQSVALLQQQSDILAASEVSIDYAARPDLRQPGNFSVSMQTLTFYDASRNRSLTTDVYFPKLPDRVRIPTILVSNGLGARRDRFMELAQHLASYGFAVIIPDHPGSDRQRLQDFYRGLYRENFAAEEFIDRPLDISFLLDQLEHLNRTEWQQQLNLHQVGIFGYSFGGTTALSLAGATFDFEQLQHDCNTEIAITNISLLYQCRALELPRSTPILKDDRISAAYLFLPFGRSLFGETQIRQVTIPVLWEATNEDFLTPLVIEQLPTFCWLSAPNQYLVVAQGLPHARVTLDLINSLTNQERDWQQLRTIIQNYQNAFSVAFFKAHVAEEEPYFLYLKASYAKALTIPPHTLSFAQSSQATASICKPD